MARAFELDPAPPAGFVDVSGSHAESIDALAASGVTVGCRSDPLQFCPSRSVTRSQMASFLARALGLIELPASVRFTAIDTGSGHSCGLRADRTIVCWGANDHGQARAPEGQFSVVSAGWKHSCAVRMDGTVACWGSYAYDRSRQPEGRFKTVSVGFHASCGVRVDGTVDCWEAGWHDAADAPVKTGVLDGKFTTVSVGHHHACGLRSNGEIGCWGDNDSSQVDAPSGRFLEVGAGGLHSCGLRVDGTVACWGTTAERRTVAGGSFKTIAVGFDHGCGLRPDATVHCWGSNSNGQTHAPGGRFEAVAAGSYHSCGLRPDATVRCWGYNEQGQADAPGGRFEAVAAGAHHSCGLRADSTVHCWGGNSNGQADAPSGAFSAVSAGLEHSCGLREDSTVRCWGGNSNGQGDAPSGAFSAVSAGHDHSCGLSDDATIVCWGRLHHIPVPTGVRHDTPGARPAPGDCRPYADADVLGPGFPLEHRALPSSGMLRVAVVFVDFPDEAAPYSTHREAERAFRFGGALARGIVTTDEGTVTTIQINTDVASSGRRDPEPWGFTAAHELMHNLGLADLYTSDDSLLESVDVPTGKELTWINLGLMGLSALFPAPEDDPERAYEWYATDGVASTGVWPHFDAPEMLAWSRWQVGWLDPHQVVCVADDATVRLKPVAVDPGEGIGMAAVPLSDHEVIVIESRRKIGYDARSAPLRPDGTRRDLPALGPEGVLVYTVDASIGTGQVPIKVVGSTGYGVFDDYPLLAVGGSVTVRGYTVTVVADDGDTHTVTITRADEG